MIDRRAQLQSLAKNLAGLCELLVLDPRCQWSKHFASSLARANFLLAGEFSQDDLRGLSSSVNSVFGGMGSFSDYVPTLETGNGKFVTIPGMERLEDLAGQVYNSALELRVVGRVP